MKKLLSLLSLICVFGLAVSCETIDSSSTSSTSPVTSSEDSSEVGEATFTVTKKSDVIYEKGSEINWTDFVTYNYVVDGVPTTPEVTVSEAVNGEVEVTFTVGELSAKETFNIYYAVDSVEDWAAMNEDLTAYYALTSDIDFADGGFVTVGHSINDVDTEGGRPIDGENAFSGVFDGNGYSIKNAKHTAVREDLVGIDWEILTPSHYSFGLFGVVSGTVRNFEVVGASFGSMNFSAIVASLVTETGTVSDVVISDSEIYDWYGSGAGIVWTNKGTVKNVYMTDVFVEQNPDENAGDSDYVKLYFAFNSGTITNILSNNAGLQAWPKVDENYAAFRLTETTTPYASDVTGTVENVRVLADWEVNEGNIANSFANFNDNWVIVFEQVPTLVDNNLLA